ncbi:MAG: hypothetical protein ACFFBD_08310 [Candidatus Hodarchaeota archaeon]
MTSAYTKTRKFFLRPRQSTKQKNIPVTLTKLILEAQKKCASDLEFSLNYLQSKKPRVLEFLTTRGLSSQELASLTQLDLEYAHSRILDTAQQVIFQEIYPKQFLNMLNQLTEIFEQLSIQHPGAFRESSPSVIRELLRFAPFNQLRIDLSKSNIRFSLANEEFCFHAEIIEAAFSNLYFAYRNKIIRDASLQLLARHLAHSSDLVPFFQVSDLSFSLVNTLYEPLKADLERLFPGWEVSQLTIPEYMNLLRQVRHMACEALNDEVLVTHFQACLHPTVKRTYSQAIVESFAVHAHRKKKTLPEYFVDSLMHKLQFPLKALFYDVWTNYLLKQRRASSLVGLERLIYDFMLEYVKEKPECQQWSGERLWQALHDPTTHQNQLVQLLEQTRPIFQALITQQDFHHLAGKGLEAFIATTYQTTRLNNTQTITIPDKKRVFQIIHRATPLQIGELTPTGELTSDVIPALQNCLEEFLLTRFQRRAEKIRPALVKDLLPNLIEVLTDPRHFITKTPEFKKPGFIIPLSDKLFRFDPQTKEVSLALTFSTTTISSSTNWFTFTLEDQRLNLGNPEDGTKTRLSAMLDAGWRLTNYFLSYRASNLYLHIQFEKTVQERLKLSIGTRKKTVREIVVGVKLGLDSYATISVMRTQSEYWRDQTGKIQRTIDPVEREEIARYFIREAEALEKKFDALLGTFKSTPKTNDKGQMTRNQFKTRLRSLLREQRQALAQIHASKNRFPNTYNTHPEYLTSNQLFSALQDAVNCLLATLIQSVAAKTKDVVVHYAKAYPDHRIRVQVEDLNRTSIYPHTKGVQSHHHLTQEQVSSLYYRIQSSLAHLLREYNIGVWRVDPKRSSHLCAYCGHKGQSRKKLFICTNEEHKGSSGTFTCHLFLNIARNFTLFPPLAKKSLAS